jgi:putrescine aminotransferase
MNKEAALKESSKILELILKDELTKDEKDQIVKESLDNFNNYVNPGWLDYRKSVSTNAAYVEWQDSEETFADVYGEEFIDCLGGYGIYNCGHRNPEIVKYVKKQLDRFALHSQELIDPLRGYLAKTVALATPGDLQYAFFTNGGAEAVEMAIKLARLATGKRWYISMVNGFHGKSMGAVSMTGKGTYREPYLPIIQQVQHVEYGNAEAIETAIKNLVAVGETVAGVILEPIQGEAGIVIPPKGYLKKVREICDKYDVVMICDEIQTGMGRTGSLWVCEEEGVVPDVLTFGKSFGGGVMPITGIIARPHLWTDKIKENPWILGSPTFGGNPLACAASLAAFKYVLENDLPKQAKEKGEYLMGKLKELQKKHPALTDVRGRGLLIGLEFVQSDVGYAVAKGMFKRKVLTAGTLNNAKVIRIEPPLIQKRETMDIVIQKLDEALTDAEKEFNLV